MSVYLLQWQVVLFIQGLLLIDSEMTNDVGFIAIGVSLLVLNLLLVVVIGLGARETMKSPASLKAIVCPTSRVLGARISTCYRGNRTW